MVGTRTRWKLVSDMSHESSVTANHWRRQGVGHPEQRRYPQHEPWKNIVQHFENFANTNSSDGFRVSILLVVAWTH